MNCGRLLLFVDDLSRCWNKSHLHTLVGEWIQPTLLKYKNWVKWSWEYEVFGSGLCRDAAYIRPVADSECSTWKTLKSDLHSPKKTVMWKDHAKVIVLSNGLSRVPVTGWCCMRPILIFCCYHYKLFRLLLLSWNLYTMVAGKRPVLCGLITPKC